MYTTANRTALLIAAILKRSGKTRARISERTFKLLSGRVRLRGPFVVDVSAKLADLGVLIVEADRGGFGLVSIPALEGAPALTAKNYLQDWKQISDDDLFTELGVQTDDEDE